MIIAASILTLIMLLLPSVASASAPYYEGRIRVTFRDSARNKDVPITIIYPADSSSGDNRPVVGTGINAVPTFGVLVMGHGYQMPVTAYKSFATNICKSAGSYIVVLPETGTGLFPSHNDFALDMVAACAYMQREGKRQGSVWFGHIANDNVFSGHSMGGGAAFLAAKQALQKTTLNVTAVIGMAPAETNPSSSAAAAFVTCPTLILAGGIDCVTPLAGTVRPIYNSVASTCKTLAIIPGASHCQFADANSTCTLGELNCQATISRDAQFTRCWQYIKFLLDRNDSVASAVGDTQVESSLVAIKNSEISINKTTACAGDTIYCRYNGKGANVLWLPDSVRGSTYTFIARAGAARVSLANTTCFGTTKRDTTIQVLEQPTLRIDGPKSICPGDSAILQVVTNATPENPMSIRWSTGATSQRIVVREPGVYTASAESERGCGTLATSHTLDVVVTPNINVRLWGDTIVCGEFKPLMLELVGDLDLADDIMWSTGDTTRRISVATPGAYTLYATLRMRGDLPCLFVTDTVVFTLRNVQPTIPDISIVDDTLWSSVADTYSWMFDGAKITGATLRHHVPMRSGLYAVETTRGNEWGCPAISKTLRVVVSSVDEHVTRSLYVNVADNTLHLPHEYRARSVRLVNASGQIVYALTSDAASTVNAIDLTNLATGIYAVIVDGNWLGNFVRVR